MAERREPGRLIVVPTPIGNLEDFTRRAERALREADAIAAEDTRRSRILLDRYGVRRPMVSYHEHNERARTAELLRRIEGGERIALLTDAGTPGVSDPGYRLIAACRDAGLAVEALPGPSAVTTALVASGLPTDAFTFVGFFPVKDGERSRLLDALRAEGRTVVGFESPKRLVDLLEAVHAVWGGGEAAVCRELTKLHEEVARGSPKALAERFAAGEVRGEITVVLRPPPAEAGDWEAALAARLGAGASPKEASAEIAEAYGVAKRTVYQRALALKSTRD